MRLAVIHSQQPHNQYAGGPAGAGDSEQMQMRALALQLIPLLRAAGADVIGPAPIGPDWTTNVKWENAQRGVDLLISLHSNAAGDGMILWGPSSTSARYGRAIMDALNADNPLPDGDRWTYYDRKVAEVASTKAPAVLLEVHRHDTVAGADWIRRGVTDGSIARNLARPLIQALGLNPIPATANTTKEEDSMPTPAEIAQAVWHYPMVRRSSRPDDDFWGQPIDPAAVVEWADAAGAGLHTRLDDLAGQIAGLTSAIAQLAETGDVDMDAIIAAVRSALPDRVTYRREDS